ncbi:DUF996 domain-containing protein [Persephonella sp.]
MDFQNIKTLGGLGGLFISLSILPYIGWMLMLIGYVLMIITLKKISDFYPDRKILKNFVIGLIIIFAGGFIGGFVGLMVTLPLMKQGEAQVAGIGMMVTLFFMYIFIVTGSYFIKNAFISLFEITGQKLFRLGGLFIFWGAVAGIILIGFIGTLIGWILITTGFFTLNSTNQETPQIEEG